ncbi:MULTISPECIES: hypothetical protein [Streptomyces]|uniref:Secreted protein n=1 Tax=Streptomyces ardesiacus TaxID=285564 RepID=A0ABW8H1K5_9ACTN|nr:MULTISPECIES: hypothetical protein [unclassified Streptomyces]KOT95382.1 hypothetical protein ADK87_26990 [Streptomyces sp. NRRL F-4711]KOX26154.1 hypothetical protein ADL07_32695 [Streptomyces sp. NRRL F-4707]NEB65377.1 hypothetical protein [Streptomyces diastaticus]
MSGARARTTTAVAALALAVVTVSAATAHADARWLAADLTGVGDAALTGVTRVDGDTTWAYGVGVGEEGRTRPRTPLLLTRDDGERSWRRLPMPAFADRSGQIGQISAVSQDDAWMVGQYEESRGAFLTQHWDGTEWRVVDAPAPEGKRFAGAGLLDVSARASDDVWAVGWLIVVDSEVPTPGKPGGTTQETHAEAVVEHWDGEAWHLVPVPDAASLWTYSVTALAEDDVWVSGYTSEDRPAMLHYDGVSWSRVPVPYDGVNGELVDLEARGADDVWAAGRKLADDEDPGHALLAHWDGRSWRQVRTPAGAGRVNDLTLAPAGVVVAGERPDGTPYVMRLRHGRWSELSVPSGGTDSGRYLTGVAWTPGGVTAVGYEEAGGSLPTPVLLTGGR